MAYGDNIQHPQSPYIALQAYIAAHQDEYGTARAIAGLYDQLGIPGTRDLLEMASSARVRDYVIPRLDDQKLAMLGIAKDASTGEYTIGGTSAAAAISAEEARYPQKPVVSGGASATPPASPTNTTATGPQPPTTQLQPGATGAPVKQLQDFLVSKGFMTQAQVNTGYGTYGPKTTAAVKAYQQSLGVDNSSGPGYWGPKTIAAASAVGTSTPIPASTGTPGATRTQATPAVPQGTTDQQYERWLGSLSLPDDQKGALRAVYDSVSSNDAAKAEQVTKAMAAAREYSSPYFDSQIKLVTDALQRGLSSSEGDLQFDLQQKKDALAKLQADTAASKDYLSFQHQQELKALEQKYKADIQDTQDAMAATGFTTSSRRARAEQILSDTHGNAVESSTRGFAYQTSNLDRSLTANEQDVAAQIANLQRLAAEGKIDLLRKAEGQIGSTNLGKLGYETLGGVGGSIPRAQAQDQLSFASSFAYF